jgi:hypothetical protein
MDAAAIEGDPPRAADPAARRRPGMAALLYAYRAVAALLIATPAALLAGEIVSGYPRGDAELFDPGGVMLVEAARLARRALMPLALQGGLGAIVAALVGLIPFAALVTALGHEGKLSARFLSARAVAPLGTLALLWGSALLAQVGVVGLVAMVSERLLEQAGMDLIREDLARVGVVIVGLAVVLGIGVVHDLARVIAVLDGRGFYMSAARALRVMERAYARALWAYAWRGALAIAALSAAAWVSHRVGLSGSRSFALVALVSQAAVFLAVFLRASWLAAAIRITDAVVFPEVRSLAEELDDPALQPSGPEAVALVEPEIAALEPVAEEAVAPEPVDEASLGADVPPSAPNAVDPNPSDLNNKEPTPNDAG